MSASEELGLLLERLCSMGRIIKAVQKQPYDYMGVSLYDNEVNTLNMIAQNEGISQIALSERMFRTKGATSAVVDKLVEKMLVVRERVDFDQRRYLLTLTDRGHLVVKAYLALYQEHARKITDALPITCADLEAANRVLGLLSEYYPREYLNGAHGMDG